MEKNLVLLFAVCIGFIVAGEARASLIWDGSFNVGDKRTGIYTFTNPAYSGGCMPQADSIVVVPAPGGRSGYAAKFTVKPGAAYACESSINDQHDQITKNLPDIPRVYRDVWLGWSQMLDPTWKPNGTWNIWGLGAASYFNSLNNTGLNLQQGYYANDNSVVLLIDRNWYKILDNYAAGAWYDWMFHVKWARDNTGFLEVYLKTSGQSDYSMIFSKYNFQTEYPFQTPETNYMQARIGMYRGYNSNNTQIQYYFNPKIGTTRADVAYSATCAPTTCAALGYNCNSASNGCGGTLNCGNCPASQQCAGNVCAAIPTDSMVGYWKFDTASGIVAPDSSGNNDSGTLNGPAWVTGKQNGALQFDGVNDSVTCSNCAPLQIAGAITLEGWVKIANLSKNSHLFGRGRGFSGDGNNGYAVEYYSGNKNIYFDTHSMTKRDALATGANSISDNNWHHIAAVWDGTTNANGKKIYIDGVLAGQKTSTIAVMGVPNYNFTMGLSGANSNPLGGALDEVKVYKRALTAAEILAEYRSGNAVCKPTTCNALGYACDTASDGCGGTLNCGLCSTSYACAANKCVATCTNECSTSGAKQCSGNGVQTCGNYDADSCLEWSTVAACSAGQTCLGGACKSLILNFIPPTADNGVTVNRNWAEINASINGQNLGNLKFNWNGSDYSFYDNSLVLAQNFNNNAAIGESLTFTTDISKYNNACSISGAAWTTAGKYGSALQFNGVKDSVNCGNNPALQITGAFTLEGWVKIANLSKSSHLFGRGRGFSGDGNNGYAVEYYSGNKNIYFDTHSMTKRDALATGANSISDNNWHHIAAVWDGTTNANGKKIYIDGVLAGQKTSTIAVMGVPNYNFTMGLSGANGYPLAGSLDEIRVYNRALSTQEIAFHYQSEFKKLTSSSWSFYDKVPNLAPGTYTYQVSAGDAAGDTNSTEIRSITAKTAVSFESVLRAIAQAVQVMQAALADYLQVHPLSN